MPEQQAPPSPQSAPPRKKHKYTPWSVVAGPLALPLGLTFGKALGEAMDWRNLATVAAECGIGAVVALILALAINFFFGKEVEVRECKQPSRPASPGYEMARHALRAGIVAVLLAAATFTGLTIRDRVEDKQKADHAAGLVQGVQNADIGQVPAIVGQMTEYRKWTDPLLREENSKAADQSRKKLNTSLALLPVDASQVKYVKERLLDAEPSEVTVLLDALFPHKDQLVGELWTVVEAPEKKKESQRLRSAAALAKYDSESEKWAKVQEAVGNDLVAVPAVFLSDWMDTLRPVRAKLRPQLSVVYRNKARRETERSLATDILADYAADDRPFLADLLMDAEDKQFAIIYPKFKRQGEQGLPLLIGEINKKLPSDLPSSDEKWEKLAKRQANAAVALLRMNQAEKVWPLLKHSPDPRVRSYLIHALSPLGADANAIVKRQDEETDLTMRRALLLSLGEFGEKEFTLEDRKAVLPKVKDSYETAADPGLHAASEWLLRTWKEEEWLKQVNEEWEKDKAGREKRLDGIRKSLAKDKEKTPSQWYVNGQGQTMVIIPGPVEFLMGSPPTEAGREGGPDGKLESLHKKRIGHSFAIAAREVAVEQFLRFRKEHEYNKQYAPTPDCPVNLVTWYDAAAYCNWLSKQEGIEKDQWCYLPNDEDEYAEGMKLAPGYLKRTGYRLPSEAEWEYACRAKAVTSRAYGETEGLLEKYVWYTKNSLGRGLLPGVPGSLGVNGDCLKPNDFGLFDMLGNVLEWCQESKMYYRREENGKPSDDMKDNRDITNRLSRALRGGSFYYPSGIIRSAARLWLVPSLSHINVGFRPARTYR